MSVTLYRAAAVTDPHFGYGSYWTVSRDFAYRFRCWLGENIGGQHAVYRLKTEIANALEFPFGVFVNSTAVTSRQDTFRAAGYLWVTFHEDVFEGTTSRQYVYLGATPLPAEHDVPQKCPQIGS